MDKVSALSDKQKDCLRLVAQNMTSKQIARRLSVSEHTVDQRIRQALRVLGVPDRFEAARALANSEGPETYQRLIYQPEPLAELTEKRAHEPAAVNRRQSSLAYWFPPLGGSRHDLNQSEIVTLIVRLALVLGGGVAVLVTIGLWLMSLFS